MDAATIRIQERGSIASEAELESRYKNQLSSSSTGRSVYMLYDKVQQGFARLEPAAILNGDFQTSIQRSGS
jgi:hypothetical protein